jgi:class 3 adenylate cyclase
MLGSHWRRIQDDVIEFIVGRRPEPVPESRLATVLFTDIVDSTARGARLGDAGWRSLLERHDRSADRVVSSHHGRIVKLTGDGLLAMFDDPAQALTAAFELRLELSAIELPIRAGLHAGVIEMRDTGDIAGIAVNIAARVQERAAPDEVLVSATVRDLLLGTLYRFEDRGEAELKGVEGTWRHYAATC